MRTTGEAPAVKSRLVFVLGSFFFAGCFPRLRGTLATLIQAALLFAVEEFLRPPWWWTLPAAAAVFVPGIRLATLAERRYGSRDPGWFVLDELVGVLLSSTGLLALCGGPPWRMALAVFVAFRSMDILKLPPIRRIERRLHGGVAVFLDDVLAAFYAWPIAWSLLALAG